MGIDIHIGDHYWPIGHIHTAGLLVGAVIAVVVIWKLRFAWAPVARDVLTYMP